MWALKAVYVSVPYSSFFLTVLYSLVVVGVVFKAQNSGK